MRTAIAVLILIAGSGLVFAESPLIFHSPDPIEIPPVRDVLYCQDPDPMFNAIQSSSGYGTEVSDDIPIEMVGGGVDEVVLYVAEWGDDVWLDPDGIVINFYYSECPPDLEPDLSYTFAWSDLSPELVYSGGWVTYRVTAALPEIVPILAEMSIGGYVLNPWGTDEPFCGLGVTALDDIYGCGAAYLDAPDWGYIRWTSTTWPSGLGYDMAYCLNGGTVASETMTWGAVRSLYR